MKSVIKNPKRIKAITERVNLFLLENRMSASDLAEAINVRASTMSNWLNGSSIPNLDNFISLAAYLSKKGVDLIALLKEGRTQGGEDDFLRTLIGDLEAMLQNAKSRLE